MAQVGGQQWQPSFGILTGPVPLHECICRETVAHVVQTRASTVGCAPQTDLPRQRIKRSMNVSRVQAVAPAGDEQIGGHSSSCPMSLKKYSPIGALRPSTPQIRSDCFA